MNAELKEFTALCETCRAKKITQRKENLMCHELPEISEKVDTYIFMINGCDYLVTIDNLFNYRGIDKLRYEKAFTTVRKVKSHVEDSGIPDTVISDSGPKFTSQKFSHIPKEWNINVLEAQDQQPRAQSSKRQSQGSRKDSEDSVEGVAQSERKRQKPIPLHLPTETQHQKAALPRKTHTKTRDHEVAQTTRS